MKIDVDCLEIGSSLYDVKFVKKLKDRKNEELYGHIDYCDLYIEVCTKYPLLRQLQTILHEALHGIDDELGIERTEKETNLFSNALFAFMVNNPVFVRMVIDYQKEK